MLSLKNNRIVEKMLDRLFAALVNGPSLNARPHSSRQRIDLTQLAKFKDLSPEQLLKQILENEKNDARIVARVPAPKKKMVDPNGARDIAEPDLTPEEKAARQAYSDQQSVLNKLRSIAEDARSYENDTGVHVLQIGFPLLSLPPGSAGRGRITRRILAPICLISVSMTVKAGPNPSIIFKCRQEGSDLIVPNIALLAWLETQAGREIGELNSDESGKRPWDEIFQLVNRVAHLLSMPVPQEFESGAVASEKLALRACPRGDDQVEPQIISSAVVGLFPLANEGLIRDTQAMLAGEPVSGPIESFVDVAVSLEPAPASQPSEPIADTVEKKKRDFADERLITSADPCQTRAVKLARKSRGLVVHGPPGTGKSQTIANVIGDHLGRGQRVLFVCDKRTALDVVMNRLESMGLGNLCAVVHDPQRDQRELYKAIREQLDNLTEQRTNASAEHQVGRIDTELQQLHAELTECHAALMRKPDTHSPSFHDLMGRWLQTPTHNVEFKEQFIAGVPPEQLETQTQLLQELFQRGVGSAYATNPWVAAAGISLGNFLATPMDDFRAALDALTQTAMGLDQTLHPSIPPFSVDEDVIAAGADRAALAERLKRLTMFDPSQLKKCAVAEAKVIQAHAQQVEELRKQTELIEQGPLNAELKSAIAGSLPSIAAINLQISSLNDYCKAMSGFLGFLAFGKKSAANKVLATYGLQLSPENAARASKFLAGLKARLLIQACLDELSGSESKGAPSPDQQLVESIRSYTDLFDAFLSIERSPHLKALRKIIAEAVGTPETLAQLIDGLTRSPTRAQAIAAMEQQLPSTSLFGNKWIISVRQHIRSGKAIAKPINSLRERLASLEDVLRIREGLSKLPEAISQSAAHLLGKSVAPEIGLDILMKSSLSLEIATRLRSDPRLQATDSRRLQSTFQRYTDLDSHKKTASREAILHLWGSQQKERLLALTGSRLNSAGADLRRRLTLRGEGKMRLRQVIAIGQDIADGDPLFDLRPVWMASPETVAQIFARKPLFDVIVFDEASQCRLEEALPVLLRGNRVVIAGDPKQLPPTRFFESAVAASDEEEIETDQQLFESQQGEIEDLLAAALNIEIEECYLDVHYRSRNSDLIEFSNGNFYGSRLQPIPGHPANRSRFAPLTLYRVDGLYKDRQNEAEAEKVCEIVRDLLRRAEPPSIGVACFNITQRDLILEKLEDLAEADPEFGKALEVALKRRGAGSFEGLFVKNLENVQGDERDHMIISTTYGRDATGKFYRRFGPVGRAGGGRRLNVLVTRARDEVHLVTSIPESEYRHLPPIPPGQTPGGPWLLFSYLAYAEQLAETYEQTHRILSQAQENHEPTFNLRPTKYPSEFCAGLGRHLIAAHKTGSDVFWGNDGFCVDLALQHPKRPEDVTVGVLCDSNRFEQAADPVEWEVFRTLVLESQGWKLHRLWTPHFFRDRRGGIDAILKDVETFLATEIEKDAIRVNNEGELPS